MFLYTHYAQMNSENLYRFKLDLDIDFSNTVLADMN